MTKVCEGERERERERKRSVCIHVVSLLPNYLTNIQSEASGGDTFCIKEGVIEVDTYLGVSALIHNSSNLGFFKRRGAVNW